MQEKKKVERMCAELKGFNEYKREKRLNSKPPTAANAPAASTSAETEEGINNQNNCFMFHSAFVATYFACFLLTSLLRFHLHNLLI